MKAPYNPTLSICNDAIRRNEGLSQPTTSHYLALLNRCDLLIATRLGQWTHYKRNEATIKAFTQMLKQDL
jgi:ArsR family transcriptional regulator